MTRIRLGKHEISFKLAVSNMALKMLKMGPVIGPLRDTFQEPPSNKSRLSPQNPASASPQSICLQPKKAFARSISPCCGPNTCGSPPAAARTCVEQSRPRSRSLEKQLALSTVMRRALERKVMHYQQKVWSFRLKLREANRCVCV